MERTGVPPEEFKNRASDGTSLLFSTKTRYLEMDAWPPLTAQIREKGFGFLLRRIQCETRPASESTLTSEIAERRLAYPLAIERNQQYERF